ncbi:MAG: hypothetical protein Q9183_006697, partial [Haloplaca sp. 2 TL-2023]
MATRFLAPANLACLLILLGPACLFSLLATHQSTFLALQDPTTVPDVQAKTQYSLPGPESSKVARSYGTQDFTVNFSSPSSALTKRAPYTFQGLICKGEKYYQQGVLQAQAGNGPPGPAFTEDDLKNGWEYKEARFPTVPDGWVPVMEAMRAGVPERDEIYRVNLDASNSFVNARGVRVN